MFESEMRIEFDSSEHYLLFENRFHLHLHLELLLY